MSEIDHINVFDDRSFQRRIVCWSAAVVAVGVAAGVAWVVAVTAINERLGLGFCVIELASLGSLAPWCVSLVAAVLVALVAHELVHGFLFKRFAPPGARVTYGINWQKGMAYACAEGAVYAREHYEVIVLAPTVAVTCVLLALGIGLGWPLWTLITVFAHLSGCTGDWGYLWELHRNPEILWCEDTPWGVRFYGEDAPGGAAGLHVVEGFGAAAGQENAALADEAYAAAGGAVAACGAAELTGAEELADAAEVLDAAAQAGADGALDAEGPEGAGEPAGADGAPSAAGSMPRGLEGGDVLGDDALDAVCAPRAADGALEAETAAQDAAPASKSPAEAEQARPVFVLVSGGVQSADAPGAPEPGTQALAPDARVPVPEPPLQDPAAGE